MTAAGTMRMVCIGPTVLQSLRESLESVLGEQAAQVLQEVGYSAGPEIYESFRPWLDQRANVAEPLELDASYLGPMMSEFFEEIGWGTITMERLGDAVLAIDTTDWVEVGTETTATIPSCPFTTGLLASFMTELAGDVMAVMQVECLTCGDDRCRFLAGSPAALQRVFDAMTEGKHYSEELTPQA